MKGPYSKTDLQNELGITYNQLQKILNDDNKIPVISNLFDSRKIYNNETISYIKDKYNL